MLTKQIHEQHDAGNGQQVVVEHHGELVHALLVCGVLRDLRVCAYNRASATDML
jgi:hypothetical protein